MAVEKPSIDIPMGLRPVGHITDLIRRLERWAEHRDRKDLRNHELRVAIEYLRECRDQHREPR